MKKSKILALALSLTILGCTDSATSPVLNVSPIPSITTTSMPSANNPEIILPSAPSTSPTSIPSSDNSEIPLPTPSPYPIVTPSFTDSPISFPTAVPSVTPTPLSYSYEGATELNTLHPLLRYEPKISMNQSGNFAFAYTYSKTIEELISDNQTSIKVFNDSYVKTFIGTNNNDFEIKKDSKPYNISIDNQGNFIVLYTNTKDVLSSLSNDIYIRKYSPTGIPLTDEINVITVDSTKDIIFSANITMNSNNEVFISWFHGKRNSDPYTGVEYKRFEYVEVITQKFDSLLKPVSNMYKMKFDITSTENLVDIQSAIDKDNNYYFSWEYKGKISITKFDKNGNFLFTKQDLIFNNFEPTKHSIIFDNNNQLIIVWLKKYEVNTLYIRKYSLDLSTFKEERVSLDDFNVDLNKPALTVDSKNNITVGWSAKDNLKSNTNILTRKYDSTLEPLNEETLINELPLSPDTSSMIYLDTDINDNLYIFFKVGEISTYLKKYDKNGILIK